MSKLVIEGLSRLEGEIFVQGSKNSVLPILAASIINGGESVLSDCPQLSDVSGTINILKHLGCKVKQEKSTFVINSSGVLKNEIPCELMRKMRSSIIFLGALISRLGSAKLSLPGGCELGPRPIDLHLEGLRQMGLRINESHGVLECETPPGGLVGANVILSFPSVGATENLILAAVKARGVTTIKNAAKEPEILDLADYLNKCGAKINFISDGTIIIDGVKKFHNAKHRVIPDRIVAITYMAAAAATSGNLILKNIIKDYISSVLPVFEEAGCIIKTINKNTISIEAPSRLSSNRLIRTMPYPGFPTDAQAPIMAMTTVSEGTSVFVENIFVSRYKHVGELMRLGADIKVEAKVAIVEGVKRLSGAEVTAADLRGAAALVIAGLCAEGTTKISGLKYLDRGYENIESNLKSIGAKISRK